MRHSAFTLIEIIVTILILGFIATGMPMIIATDLDTREDSLIQEAIYASTAKMSQILSYKWDEQSNEDNNTISGSKVLDVTPSADTDIALHRNNGKFRAGHFQETGRRSMYSDAVFASALGKDLNDNDDIDDATSLDSNFLTGTSSAEGYKDSYTMDIHTSYIIDTSSDSYLSTTQNNFEFENETNNITNIKRIQIDVLDANKQRLFTLRTYSCNIGESSIASRIFN